MPPSNGRRGQDAMPAEPAIQHRALAALFLALLSMVGLFSLNYLQRGVYLVGYALLAGVMAMWLAVTSIARARRSRAARPKGSVTAIVIAGAGIILSAILLLAFAAFGQQLHAYGRCMGAASTSADQQACQNQLIHAVNHEISAVRAGGSG